MLPAGVSVKNSVITIFTLPQGNLSCFDCLIAIE